MVKIMKTYNDEILEEAIAFLEKNKKDIIKALTASKNFDSNDIDCLDTFTESINPSFTVEDAITILDESSSEGESFGEHNPEKALIYKAVNAYQNDVWFKTKELYKEMKEQLDELNDNDEPFENATKKAFDKVISIYSPPEIIPVEKDSPEERKLIGNWLLLRMLSGVGVDTR